MDPIEMESKAQMWGQIEDLVRSCGFELFDLDVPASQGGVLRAFISVGKGSSAGITVDDCAKVSRAIEAWLEERGLFADNLTLEVSSPGINRKLSRHEHFEGAIGERVRLTLRDLVAVVDPRRGKELKRQVITGKLDTCTAEELTVTDEETGATVAIALRSVKDARVDFRFQEEH